MKFGKIEKKVAKVLVLAAVITMLAVPSVMAGKGNGPGNGTGDGPGDGTGNGAGTGDCSAAVLYLDNNLLLARGGNGNGGNGPGDGTGTGDGPGDGTGNGPGTGDCSNV